MNYGTLQTATLEKMLDRAAAGSAEHRALQAELRARGVASGRLDTETLELFPPPKSQEWKGNAR